MVKQTAVAILALVAACAFHSSAARADIEVKAGCDGKWVERSDGGFETYKVCEHSVASGPKAVGALHMRGHVERRIAHWRPHRRFPAPVFVRETHRRVAPVEVAAVIAPPRRDNECVALNCPQFMMVGIGF